MAIEERCEFLPFCSPKQVYVKNKKITSMEFYKTEQTESGLFIRIIFFEIYFRIKGDWIEDEDQIIRLKCNYIISAFGSTLNDLSGCLGFDFIRKIKFFSSLYSHSST